MEGIEKIIGKQRDFFNSGRSKDLKFRLDSLKKLRVAIKAKEGEILKALKADLGKPALESYATEVGSLLEEIKYVIKRLSSWSKPRKIRGSFINFPSSSYIYSQPYGLSLIIAPWNYPFQLSFAPLIGAIAGGNCSIIKPSELAPNASRVIGDIIGECFNEGFVAVVEGGIETNQALLEENFDYIFFTGGVEVGKIVMRAAADNLTPVTLELGGKSPCIVDEDIDISKTAKRIVWGKFLNAGQTCIAPDYLLVNSYIKDDLVEKIEEYIGEFYGDDPEVSQDFARIINLKHFKRLEGLMEEGEIIVGGRRDEGSLFIEPTLIDGISGEERIMKEEIFGPILPIIEYENLSQAINFVNGYPKPLALYFFSKDKGKEDRVIKEISFGGGAINDTIMQLSTPKLPFGGIGNSGMGAYHGKRSFDTFTHKKSILKKSFLFDPKFRYPPYKNKLKWLRRIFK